MTGTDPDSAAVVEKTIIDGQTEEVIDTRSVVLFDGTETAACVLSGFTICNGKGSLGLGSVPYGGGIYGRGNPRHN